MTDDSLGNLSECLKMLAKKMEENPGTIAFDHIGGMAQTMIKPLMPQWGKAPKETRCI